MSDAVFQRSVPARPYVAARRGGRLPRGVGLMVAATVSVGFWGGIFWIVARVLGYALADGS